MSSDLKNATDTPTSASQAVVQPTSQPVSQSTAEPTSQPIAGDKKHSETSIRVCQSHPTNPTADITSDNKEKKVTITIECSESDVATVISKVSSVSKQDTKVTYATPVVQRDPTSSSVGPASVYIQYPVQPTSPMTIYPTNPFAMPFTPLPDEYTPVYARPRFLPIQPVAPSVIQPIFLVQPTRQPRGTPYGVDPNMQYRFA